ncbi:uncharacterized protein LOC142391266 [Odontesthes bonariensis]|uniref:uncharacterized protein LOC142391266 n=1 Tax=Odontesthes bonariensis TaxID=219752 RepID=UPI003F589B3A
MFSIVEFLETREVEVVPAAWVASDVCQWPCHYKSDEMSDSDDGTVNRRGSLPAAPKIKGPSVQAVIERSLGAQSRSRPEPQLRRQLVSPVHRLPVASPGNSATPAEDQQLSTAAPLCRVLTNQAMIMDHLKILTLTLQKTQGEQVGGQEVLEEDLSPLKDISSLLSVERRVREEVEFKRKMITALSVIGGVDIKDAVWRIMRYCFANSLAKQLNWRGVNGKTAFHSLQIKDVITDS